MLNKKKFIKIFFLLFLITNIAHGKPLPNNLHDDMAVEIVNKRTLSSSLPFHDFEYQLAIPKEEKTSGDPLIGRVSDHRINIKVYRYDSNNIVADLTVVDPAMGKRVIWDGQIIFDQTTNQIRMKTREQNDRYVIDFKLSPPISENPKFEIDILSL